MAERIRQESVAIGKVCAGCFGLSAFVVAIVAGMLCDNPMGTIMTRALVSMGVCYVVGAVIGMIVQQAVRRAPGDEARLNRAEAGTTGAQSAGVSEGEILSV